jgi:hypothetical protein
MDPVTGTVTTETTAVISETETASTTDSNLATVADNLGISEEGARFLAENDPDFNAFVDAKKDTGGDDGHVPPDDNSGVASAAGEDDKDAKDVKADENSGEGTDSGVFEFADDVIKGLSGEDFAKLPEAAQDALATYYQEAESRIAEAEGVKARVDSLLSDPVIKSRADMLDSGRADVQVRGMTAAEKQAVAERIRADMDLDDDEISQVMTIVGTGIENVAKQMAEDYAQQAITLADQSRREMEIAKQGNDLMLSLAQFNKSLAVKETDLSKFYSYANGQWALNEKHPEYAVFKDGLGKIMDWAQKNKIGYAQALQLGPESFYGAAAVALKMPVAFNTEERDKKMVADARKAALKPFLKEGKSNTLNPQGTQGVVDSKAAERVMSHGMDAIRLVEDGAYYDEMIVKSFGNPGMADKIAEAASVGRAAIEKRKKT